MSHSISFLNGVENNEEAAEDGLSLSGEARLESAVLFWLLLLLFLLPKLLLLLLLSLTLLLACG